MTALEVVAPGARCLVQDLGRPGLADLGVSPSGALDPLLLRRANALVGNSRGAAGLELLLGGAVLRAHGRLAVAVVGAGPVETAWLAAGEELRVGETEGLVAYVAVRGGVAVPAVLGSRSTDLLGGLGPPPVTAGTLLPVGADGGPPEPAPVPSAAPDRLRLLPGPRPEWFAGDAVQALATATWTVSTEVDRTAARLTGPALARRPGELPPEGVVRGAVQVPPSGQPVVFLADHPVTGGYPVAAVVHPEDLRHLVQRRPGQVIRFTPA